MKTFVNPRYERREGEESYEYGLRLIETKIEQKPDDLDWEDIIEATGIDCHRDSLRKAASVTPYSGYAVAQYFKKKYYHKYDVFLLPIVKSFLGINTSPKLY